MPLIKVCGVYRTRDGRKVLVRPNLEGWLDGLPFIVSHNLLSNDTFGYTVNEEGRVYPSADGAYSHSWDLVEYVKEGFDD